MRTRKISVFLFISVFLASLYACSSQQSGKINIVDAKIATGIDEKLMPIQVTNIFPAGTSRISCWIRWNNATINTEVVAKWHYVTDDTPISDYVLTIPKEEGTGSVELTIANEKGLPSGRYRVNLCLGKHVLRSLTFTVQ